MHASTRTLQCLWPLPPDPALQVNIDTWFYTVINQIPEKKNAGQHSPCCLAGVRVWHARNEATHDKALPTTQSSRRFLCSYVNVMGNIQEQPVEAILKGRSTMIAAPFSGQDSYQ
jgi:hypothetical protein